MGDVSVGHTTDESAVGSARALGQLFGEVSRELGELVKHEVELAKTELREELGGTSDGSGARYGVVAVAGGLGLLFLSFAVVWGLAEIMHAGFAFLLVGLAYAGVAAFLVWQDRQEEAGPAAPAERADEAPSPNGAVELAPARDGDGDGR